MKITYSNIECLNCKSKNVCKYYHDISEFKLTTNNNELPLDIKVSCQYFTEDKLTRTMNNNQN